MTSSSNNEREAEAAPGLDLRYRVRVGENVFLHAPFQAVSRNFTQIESGGWNDF